MIEYVKEKEDTKKQVLPPQSPKQTFPNYQSPFKDNGGNSARSGLFDSAKGSSISNLNMSYNNSPIQNNVDYGQLLQRSNASKK